MNTDELIALLRHNARTSNEDLAKELNASEEEVSAAVRELEEEGALLGYQAIVNSQLLTKDCVQAVVEVRLTPERGGGFDRLASRIARFEDVVSCYLMSGSYDLLVVVQGDTLHEIATFISEKLSTIKGVISTATHFRLKAYKENGV
ncbi:MAG: Lrp/AsnC family transcriptional regulator, partial [Verrucomicrobiaceae bacterium]